MAAPLSIRARLTLWHAGALAAVVLVFSAGVFLLVRHRLYADLDDQVARQVAAVRKVALEEPEELAELESQIGIEEFEVRRADGLMFQSQGWRDGALDASAMRPGAPVTVRTRANRVYRVAVAEQPGLRVAVALGERSLRHSLGALEAVFLLGIPFALALSLAGGYVLAGRVLRPVGALADGVRRISADRLDERLPPGNPADEFGRLASALNDALARVEKAFAQLRRFTADASHELRTPLASMRSVGELALGKPLAPAAYREAIASMLEEVDRLAQLVDSLLALTRADGGVVKPAPQCVDLRELAGSVAGLLGVLAEEKRQRLLLADGPAVHAWCDPAILRSAVTNVLHNAIKFSPEGGEVRLAVLAAGADEAAIEVADDGPGIPEADRERVFDRFYRVDGGRSRAAGGFGLGLAIARWAAEANGGRVELESAPGRGCRFRIVVPRASPAQVLAAPTAPGLSRAA